MGVKREHIVVFPGQHWAHILTKMGYFMYIVYLIIVTAIDVAVRSIKVFSVAMEM
jgi:multisubunit Na+/H+ antiporter MnhE subunit